MGTRTTMKELAAHWDTLTADERLGYRVRFGDDVLEVISIEVQHDQAAVRGYQLNGPMADTQRDDNSRAARVRMFSLNLGVEILDLDEPVENDDPGPPPTLAGPPMPLDVHPDPEARRQASEWTTTSWDYAQEMGPLREIPIPQNDGIHESHRHWAGDPTYMPPAPSVLDTPVDSWASTAIRMPHELLDRASKEAKRRGIGRNQLLAHFTEQGLNGVEGRPLV